MLREELWHSVKATAFHGLEALGLYGFMLSARRRLRAGPPGSETVAEFPEMPGGYYFRKEMDADRAIHPGALALAGWLPHQEIVCRRRHNYTRLAGLLGGVRGVKLLFPQLPERTCPLSLPLLVSNRDACVAALQARGIGALPWWAGFHRGGIEWPQFPEACRLKRQMLTLPIHQNLDDEHLTYVADVALPVLQSTSV